MKWYMCRLDKHNSGESHTYIRPKEGRYLFKLLNSLSGKTLYDFGVEKEVVESFRKNEKKSHGSGEDKLYVGKGVSGVVKFALAFTILTGEQFLCVAKKVKNLPGKSWSDIEQEAWNEYQLQSEAGIELAMPVFGMVSTIDQEFCKQSIIFMGLSKGLTLRRFIRVSDVYCNRLEKGKRKQIVLQLIAKVQLLHQRGIFHRDIKPNNMVVDVRGDDTLDIKFLDFGMATRSVGETCDYGKILVCSAPELLGGFAKSMPLDIYSLGSSILTVISDGPDFSIKEAGSKADKPHYHYLYGEEDISQIRRLIIDKINRCQLKIKNMGLFLFDVLNVDPERRPTIDQMQVGFEQWDKEAATWT